MLATYFLHILTSLKLYHWHTTSYSRHKGSDEIYTQLSEQFDIFIESAIGRYNRKHILPNADTEIYTAVLTEGSGGVVRYIKTQCIPFFQSGIFEWISHNDSDLVNQCDEIIQTFHKAIYLFSLK